MVTIYKPTEKQKKIMKHIRIPMTFCELSIILKIPESNLRSTSIKLVKEGLVSRRVVDKVTRLSLTSKGVYSLK